MKKIIKPVIVLTIFAVVCAGILTMLNHFWYISDDERFKSAVSSIMEADSFTIVYNYDDPTDEHKASEEYREIADFNTKNGSKLYQIDKVRIAVGGKNDGCYLIQSTGRGYKGAYVQMLTGFDKDGSILGTMLMTYDSINNRMALIDWKKVSASVKDKKGSVGTGNDLIARTGATRTLDGAADAINLAAEFYKTVIMGVEEKPEIVTDSKLITVLNKLYPSASTTREYTSYPIKTTEETVMGGKARIQKVYTTGDDVILEVRSSYGDYGDWTLLVLIGENNTVEAISPLSGGGSPGSEGGIDYNATALKSAEFLTEYFGGMAKEDIAAIEEKYLQGTTHATETNVGLKVAVYHALDKAESVLEPLNQYKEAANE